MRIAVPLAAALSSLVVGGCGAETGADGPAGERPDEGGRTSQDGRTELTVVVTTGPGQGERSYTLTCDPAGGDHPDVDRACQALAALEAPFATLPDDRPCTDIYGGPQEARVTGTYRGERVEAEFDRTDGCQIARWDAYVDVLVEQGGADGS